MKEEKKVEYLELIYDLIFIYIIGRNNLLLQEVSDGFITGAVFLSYVIGTLAIIQIWSFSTFYINLYGRNGIRDHVFLFINMFLLYYMANGINANWRSSVYSFNVAWALILVNIGVQHLIEMRNHKDAPMERAYLERKALIILIEAALVGVQMAVYAMTGFGIAYVPLLFGIIATILSGNARSGVSVDFAHLSERSMLFVVFTFGEMIIAIAAYFKDGFSGNTVYFSVMAFLIVTGLLLSYETMYNHVIDREMTTNGTGYIMIHVFLIFALNNISASLEFMREEEVDLLPKVLFLIGSVVLYYAFLFLTSRYAKKRCAFKGKLELKLAAASAGFVVLMIVLREKMTVNIMITVVYVFGIFLLLYRHGKKTDGPACACGE